MGGGRTTAGAGVAASLWTTAGGESAKRCVTAGRAPRSAAAALGARFVLGVHGSRTNVIGLPLDETLALLAEAGVPAETLRA